MRLMTYGTIKMARVASIANKPPPSESCHPDVGLAKTVMGIRINVTRSLFIINDSAISHCECPINTHKRSQSFL